MQFETADQCVGHFGHVQILTNQQQADILHHREITIIELQSLVVFGCTALLFMVGATASTHDREEG